MAFEIRWEGRHITAVFIGVAILIVDFVFFREESWFVPLLIIALTMAWSQHWIDFFVKAKLDKELEEKFPEFVRNLVSAVKSGMPMTRAIVQVSKTDYGGLNPYVQKLANQIEWAIPLHKALMSFATESRNAVIRRAIATVIEAEQSGGNIEDVLESITMSVIEIKKIKQERKASIHGQIVQSYIIFIVFLGVMVVIQNLLIPYVASIGQGGEDSMGTEIATLGGGGGLGDQLAKVKFDYSSVPAFVGSIGAWMVSIRGVFLMLAGIQGLFAGLVLGQLSEGNMKAGLKHSLILITLAFLVITLAQGALQTSVDTVTTAASTGLF
ncbi:type II secretion system F family protein [Thermoproteota archaeon]